MAPESELVLAGQEMKFIGNLLNALGKPDFIALCEWPGAHQKPVMDFLAATFRAKPLAHWMQWLDTLDICYGPVNTLPEAIADANLVKRGAVVVAEDGRKHFAPVVRFEARLALCQRVLRRDDCPVRGATIDGVVYLDDSLDFERPLDSSILLHELVHYVQHDRDGPATTCADWLRREQQAYSIQIQALARIGADTLAPVMAVRSLTCL